MTPRSPGAFFLSATFHAVLIGTACLLTLDSCQDKQRPKILELVAGEGDNYGATEAPKLGTPGGVKVDVPAIPEPKRPEPQPEIKPPAPEPEPVVTPAPTPPPPKTPPPKTPPPKTPPKKDPDAIPNFSKQITRKVIRAESKAKAQVKKERDAEAKRLAKEEFDRRQREKVASAKGANVRVQHIDGEGIAKGVVGGSVKNKTGGAGGTALQRDDGPITEAYYAMLVQRVKAALDKPPGLSDNLTVGIAFTISASGQISNVRVESSSGSSEWDDAVVAAFRRISMPAHPLHRSEELELSFRTNEVSAN